MSFLKKLWVNDVDKANADTLNAMEDRIDDAFLALEGIPGRPTLVEISGHSFTPGGGAYRQSQGYAEKVALGLGARRRDNRGWGGSISCWPTGGNVGDGGYPWHLQQIRRPGSVAVNNAYADLRPRQAPYLPRSQVVIHHNAQNDLAELGPNKPRPMQEAHRVIWSRYCASAIWEDEDPSWVYTGTWTNNPLVIANSGVSVRFTQTVNDKATWTCPADYPGGLPIAIGIFVNAAHDITIGVKIDGVDQPDVRLQGSAICDTNLATKNMSIVLRFDTPLDAIDLGPGAHTFEFTLKTQHIAGSLFAIDYAQIEADPADGPVIIVPSNFRPISYAMWAGWPGGPAMNDAAVATWDQRLLDIIPEFGDRMLFVDIDTALAKDPINFSSDNVHANERGHSLVAEAILAAISDSEILDRRRLTMADVTHEPWFEPVGVSPNRTPFLNSWTNQGTGAAPLGFHRHLDGRTEIRGQVAKASGSASGVVIFSLPKACWPSQARTFVVPEGDGTVGWGVINSQTNASPGGVYIIAGGAISNMAIDYNFQGDL